MNAITRFPARAPGPGARMAGFIAHLRDGGLRLGPSETAAALEALTHVEAQDPQEARLALKALCCGDREEFARFDDLFDAYWRNSGRERVSVRPGESAGARNSHRAQEVEGLAGSGAGRPEAPDDDGDVEAAHEGEGRLVGARMRNLMQVDLRQLVTPQDIAAAEQVAMRIARAIRDRRSRRKRAHRRGESLDLRRIARASIATGGEPLRLYRRKRPERPARITAILDVSGSMALYARIFLAFLKGLMQADGETDAYLFHTRLVRITDALRDGDALRALTRLSLLAQGFGGGTRIGGNLAIFNRNYARRLVSGRSVVIILSDGYDTDPPELIGEELARLKQRGCRIIWLNPLKGWKDYEPVARGMAAALPHLDLFAPANTLQSLAALEPELMRL